MNIPDKSSNSYEDNRSNPFTVFENSLYKALADKQDLDSKKKLIPLQLEVSVEELIATLTLTAKKLALLGIFVEINELIEYLRVGTMPNNTVGLLEQLDTMITSATDETTKSVLQLTKLKVTGLVLA